MARRAHRSALAAALLLTGGCQPGAAGEADLAYFSDYYSFVGADSAGRVAFALDTNRGRDGDDFQAEHFAVLHDEGAGWVELVGSGPYPNTERALDAVPDSPHFQFAGRPAIGVRIASKANALTLATEAITVGLRESTGDRERRLGSAAATLTWRGRVLDGRVIHEFVRFDGWNRLTRTYWGFWKDWQSFYLVAGDSPRRDAGDLYLMSQRRGEGRVVDGFLVLDGGVRRLADARLVVEDSDQALGLYSWANRWSGGWPGARLRLDGQARRSFANWLIGGFAMNVVTGELAVGGRTVPVYGLGELIK